MESKAAKEILNEIEKIESDINSNIMEGNIYENRKQYARNHINEKTHFVFHGGCLGCVTPLHYGLGNCLGCLYFNGVTTSYPSLRIKNFTTP